MNIDRRTYRGYRMRRESSAAQRRRYACIAAGITLALIGGALIAAFA